MAVVNVGVVRVRVLQWFMAMWVTVRFNERVVGAVLMTMVLVVHMEVLVDQQPVKVFVVVPLADVQPDPECHQYGGQR